MLRFYVRRGSKRGCGDLFGNLLFRNTRSGLAVARLLFKENYSCVPMSHQAEIWEG